MSVWCGTWSDMSDKSDKSDFIGVPQVQKTEGAAKHRVLLPPQKVRGGSLKDHFAEAVLVVETQGFKTR